MTSLTYVSVSTHRAISSMNIFKPPWPNPEASICNETRWECPGSGKSYWSARGPAEEAFVTIKDQIRQHLEDIEHHLYEGLEEASIPHAIGYFMVGSSAKRARPYVVISCQNERFSRRAMDAIKTMTWWRTFILENLGFGGFRLLRYAPRRIADMQTVTHNGWVYTSHEYENLIGLPIFFADNVLDSSDVCKPQQATLGGIIYLEDIPFGLTVAHPLIAERIEETLEYDVQHNASEFYADDSDDELSVISTSTSMSSQALVAEPSVNMASSRRQPLPGKPRLVGQFVGRSTGTAFDPFDWALISFDADAFEFLEPMTTEQSAALIRPHSRQTALSFDDTTPMALYRARGGSSEVVINANESLVCLVGSRRYLSLHSVMTKENLGVGDCGTWILDHRGGWCGHVVASIPSTNVSYLAQATGIISDIQERTGMKPSLSPGPRSRRYILEIEFLKREGVRRPLLCNLHAALLTGHDEIVKLLLDAGADVNVQGQIYGSALQIVTERGHEKMVKTLLDAGANVNENVLGRRYHSLLHIALKHGHEETVKLLLDAGADVNVQGPMYSSALQIAAGRCRTNIVKLLLDAGADVNAQGGWSSSPLQIALERGHEKIVKLLIDAGANVNENILGRRYHSLLHIALKHGHEETVKLLLDAGADVNFQGGIYGSALQIAAGRCRTNIVKLLLDAGADVNAQGGLYGRNALRAASERGHRGIVKLLLDASAHDDDKKSFKRPDGYESKVVEEVGELADITILNKSDEPLVEPALNTGTKHKDSASKGLTGIEQDYGIKWTGMGQDEINSSGKVLADV